MARLVFIVATDNYYPLYDYPYGCIIIRQQQELASGSPRRSRCFWGPETLRGQQTGLLGSIRSNFTPSRFRQADTD